MILGPDWSVADDGWPFLALAGTITIVTSIIFLPLGCFLLGIMVWLAHVLRVPTRQTILIIKPFMRHAMELSWR